MPKLGLPNFDPRSLLPGKRRVLSSLLGISLDGHRLEAVLVRRANDGLRVQEVVGASLELNLLTNDPALVGREIRNHLDRANITERNCAICLPLDWVLMLHASVPQLSPEDEDAFLTTEAERGFPFPSETLSIARSQCRGPSGGQLATLLAVPKEHLATLLKIAKAAQLRPVSFSLTMPSLQPAAGSAEGIAALGVSESNLELQVTCGGGIAALRTLEGAMEQDGVHKRPYADVVARDLRITLGQLPAELGGTIRRLRVFGTTQDFDRFAEDLTSRAKLMGLQVELIRSATPDQVAQGLPTDSPVSPALSLAARVLSGQKPELEFLPPKVSAWKQFSQQYSSAKLVWSGAAAGTAVLLVLVAFLVQQWRTSYWETRWLAIKPRVTELDKIQQDIRRFRPWFDESLRSLSIMRRLTEAFPEDGTVTAKRVEIRDPSIVTCSGSARDILSVQTVEARLRAMKEISDVATDMYRGKSPVQFSFHFRWNDHLAQ
jgi:hypothetical protein